MWLSIIQNETEWLKSISCNIVETKNFIHVSRPDNDITDFNFCIIKNNTDFSITSPCIRLHSKNANWELLQDYLFINGYIPETIYDINLIMYPMMSTKDRSIFHRQVEYDVWDSKCENMRFLSNKTVFYHVYYNDKLISKYSLIISNDVIGIYDYEVFDPYRAKGFGSRILRDLSSRMDTPLYIQTWSTNTAALKCYLKSGFLTYENLYRFTKK